MGALLERETSHSDIALQRGVSVSCVKHEVVPLTVVSCNTNKKNSVTFNMPPIQSKLQDKVIHIQTQEVATN
jgi:hypothetical protein